MKTKWWKIPGIVIKDVMELFIIYLPGQCGVHLRYLYYKRKFKSCGENVVIDIGVIFKGHEYISIGDNVCIDKYCIINAGPAPSRGKSKRKENKQYCYGEGELHLNNNIHIAQFCIIMAYGGIVVGSNCGVSSGSKIYSLTNIPLDFEDPSRIISIMPLSNPDAPFLLAPIVISENVWVALNCIIMPGVNISRNSFVASNSLVIGKFKENSYIEGSPASRKGPRFRVSNE